MKRNCLIQLVTPLLVWISCGASPSPTAGPAIDTNPEKVPPADATFTVMSYNVLHPTAETIAAGHGWESRKSHIVEQIKVQRADILLLQEVIVENGMDTVEWVRKQLTMDDMPIDYAVVGGSGTAPKDILVNKQKFEIVFPSRKTGHQGYELYGALPLVNSNKTAPEHNTVYLPPDPLTTCLSAINRSTPPPLRKTASWVHLRHRTTQKEFIVANLHLHWKHESRRDNTVRIEQLRCLSSLLHQRFPELPKIVGGDFNAELTSEELNLFQGGFGHEERRFRSAAIDKAMLQGTWNGFCEKCIPALKIDHFFVQNIEIETPTAAIHDKPNNQWPSDHCPIIATFKL